MTFLFSHTSKINFLVSQAVEIPLNLTHYPCFLKESSKAEESLLTKQSIWKRVTFISPSLHKSLKMHESYFLYLFFYLCGWVSEGTYVSLHIEWDFRSCWIGIANLRYLVLLIQSWIWVPAAINVHVSDRNYWTISPNLHLCFNCSILAMTMKYYSCQC